MTTSNIPLRTARILIFVFIVALSSDVFGQNTIQPLTAEEFAAVITSGDTLQWARIQTLTDEQAQTLAKSNGFYTRSSGAELRG